MPSVPSVPASPRGILKSSTTAVAVLPSASVTFAAVPGAVVVVVPA